MPNLEGRGDTGGEVEGEPWTVSISNESGDIKRRLCGVKGASIMVGDGVSFNGFIDSFSIFSLSIAGVTVDVGVFNAMRGVVSSLGWTSIVSFLKNKEKIQAIYNNDNKLGNYYELNIT